MTMMTITGRTVACAGLLAVTLAAGAATPTWLDREMTDSWDAPGKGLEALLNDECQPSGLDGIQLLVVQDGHGRPYHVHVYCRQDKSTTVRYRVTMPRAPAGQVLQTVRERAGDPNVRIGPFFLGTGDEPNGFLLIERLR
jgi:hypothetical protein